MSKSKILLKEIKKGTKNALTRKKIINHYIERGNSTITELSKDIDISIPTVTRFIGEMYEDGFLEDFGKLETAEGRHPNLYGLKATAAYFVGVDIKQFSLTIGLSNFRGEIINTEDVAYRFENTQESFEQICDAVVSFIDRQEIEKEKILNVNINISGRVNPESGYSYSIFYFDEEPLSEKFARNIGYNVTIDNDTRAMAYGEYMAGPVTNEKNVIFVNLSWGIAIGIVIEGKIYTGKSGFSGEFGHVKTFDNEILCHCGKKGCLETEISGHYVYDKLLQLVSEGATSLISKKLNAGKTLTLEDIIEAVTVEEDVLCIELIEEVGIKLGEQLAGLINIFNPEMVIIGGILSGTGEYIMQPIKSAIRKYSLNLVSKDSSIVLSNLKDKAGVVGACLMARYKTFKD